MIMHLLKSQNKHIYIFIKHNAMYTIEYLYQIHIPPSTEIKDIANPFFSILPFDLNLIMMYRPLLVTLAGLEVPHQVCNFIEVE